MRLALVCEHTYNTAQTSCSHIHCSSTLRYANLLPPNTQMDKTQMEPDVVKKFEGKPKQLARAALAWPMMDASMKQAVRNSGAEVADGIVRDFLSQEAGK